MAESGKRSRHGGSQSSPHNSRVASSAHDLEQLVVTMNKATHEVLKIARLDATGQLQELSQADSAEIAGENSVRELVQAVDEAYRAGLAEGLAMENDEEEVDDDILMQLALSHSTHSEGMQPEVRTNLLRPLLLRRLLRHHIIAARPDEQPRRTPIANSPRNGSTSNMSSHPG